MSFRIFNDTGILLICRHGPPKEGNRIGGLGALHAAALTDFCLALFNLNEFVYVD